jgi:hypothetical protein
MQMAHLSPQDSSKTLLIFNIILKFIISLVRIPPEGPGEPS